MQEVEDEAKEIAEEKRAVADEKRREADALERNLREKERELEAAEDVAEAAGDTLVASVSESRVQKMLEVLAESALSGKNVPIVDVPRISATSGQSACDRAWLLSECRECDQTGFCQWSDAQAFGVAFSKPNTTCRWALTNRGGPIGVDAHDGISTRIRLHRYEDRGGSGK